MTCAADALARISSKHGKRHFQDGLEDFVRRRMIPIDKTTDPTGFYNVDAIGNEINKLGKSKKYNWSVEGAIRASKNRTGYAILSDGTKHWIAVDFKKQLFYMDPRTERPLREDHHLNKYYRGYIIDGIQTDPPKKQGAEPSEEEQMAIAMAMSELDVDPPKKQGAEPSEEELIAIAIAMSELEVDSPKKQGAEPSEEDMRLMLSFISGDTQIMEDFKMARRLARQ